MASQSCYSWQYQICLKCNEGERREKGRRGKFRLGNRDITSWDKVTSFLTMDRLRHLLTGVGSTWVFGVASTDKHGCSFFNLLTGRQWISFFVHPAAWGIAGHASLQLIEGLLVGGFNVCRGRYRLWSLQHSRRCLVHVDFELDAIYQSWMGIRCWVPRVCVGLPLGTPPVFSPLFGSLMNLFSYHLS